MPSEPLAKAKDRAWIEFSSQILMDQYRLSVSNNTEGLEKEAKLLNEKLERLEAVISSDGYFNGASLSLVDTALAPLFTRFNAMKDLYKRDYLEQYSKLSALSDRLLSLESVKKSVIPDFAAVYLEYNRQKDSVLAA